MPHIPPPVIALIAAGAQRALRPHRCSGSAQQGLAVILAVGSAGVAAAAVRQFVAVGTAIDPTVPARASTLVTGGPNAWTRNPMYLALSGLLTAHAVARGGWAPVLPVAAFIATIDRLQIQPEEEALRARFGSEYEDYCTRVRRWV
ncbi:MAG: isoprenylcysteine carboxylmethyltransferase family protein [Knoellia sp.]